MAGREVPVDGRQHQEGERGGDTARDDERRRERRPQQTSKYQPEKPHTGHQITADRVTYIGSDTIVKA